MLYLWVFGDNVEDRLGHLRFLVFYLLCGVSAAAAQVVANPYSAVPMVGASGAIAGILGAYLLFFPRARVLTLVPLFVFLHFVEIPAIAFLVLWFVMQLAQGFASLSAAAHAGGVAWWAHAGGFAAGFLLGGLLGWGRGRRTALRARPASGENWPPRFGGTPWDRH